ncbi:MAG: cupin domain-containing protein [Actinomycetales bacterium]
MSQLVGTSGQTGRPALARLIDCGVADFEREYWDRQPLLSHGESYEDLFSVAAADELLSMRGLRAPFVRVARQGRTLADRDFTAAGGVGAGVADQVSEDRILEHFASGATIVLQALHRTWPPLTAFAQQLHDDLGHPVQVNAYLTPSQSRGFDHHYDVHDVFVLQVNGCKQWRIHEPVHQRPLRTQPWTSHTDEVRIAAATKPLIDAVLEPGDCLYLPRGYVHAATALGGTSAHVTIGVHPWTRRHLAEALVGELLDAVGQESAERAALPLGLGGDGEQLVTAAAGVQRALARALGGLDLAEVAGRVISREAPGTRAEPVPPLTQAEQAQRLEDTSLLRLRAHLAPRLTAGVDGSVVLSSRAGRITLTTPEGTRVGDLLGRLAATSFPAAELGVPLSRRLMLAGILVPA